MKMAASANCLTGTCATPLASGLYKPKSDYETELRAHEYRGGNSKSPFHINIVRDWSILGITFLISALTLIGIAVTVYFTKRQWHEAERSATAAETTLSDERQNFVREHRPYLSALPQGAMTTPNPAVFAPFQERGGRHGMAVKVVITDVGRTPAIEVDTSDTIYIVDIPDVAESKARSFVPQYRGTRSVVAPGPELVPRSDVRVFSGHEWEDFQDPKRLSIYVVGSVQYRDLFSPKTIPPYRTDYCYHLVPNGIAFGNCDWDVGFRGQMK